MTGFAHRFPVSRVARVLEHAKQLQADGWSVDVLVGEGSVVLVGCDGRLREGGEGLAPMEPVGSEIPVAVAPLSRSCQLRLEGVA